MGRYYNIFEFPESDTQDVWIVHSAFLTYQLSDGESLDLRTTAGWCETCDQIVLLEHVPDLETLLVERIQLEAPDQETLLVLDWNKQTTEEALAELDRYILWRKSRIRGSQCLSCGSTNTIPLPNLKEFPHPVTQELVRKKEWGFCSTNTWEQVFDSEGNPLPTIHPETFPKRKSQE